MVIGRTYTVFILGDNIATCRVGLNVHTQLIFSFDGMGDRNVRLYDDVTTSHSTSNLQRCGAFLSSTPKDV